jgi:DNA (cytosine-5)-methyltransferase 1
MKILNLYACLGGNRYKWGDEDEITAVEIEPEICEMYQKRFPNDTVICGDAHQYLLEHYKEFDFIWSSPPCPTHSRLKHSQKNKNFFKPEYPNMMLYQEIIFLQTHFKGKFCVENVIPYYEPLIPAQKRGRHLYWCNFVLPQNVNERHELKGLIGGENKKNNYSQLCELHEIDLTKYKGKTNKIKLARNLVDFQVGKTILEVAKGIYEANKNNQLKIF